MFRAVEMSKVNVLVLNRHVTSVTRRLGDMGLVHLVDAVEQSEGHLLSAVGDGQEVGQLQKLQAQCEQLVRQLGIDDGMAQEGQPDLTKEELTALLGRIQKRFDEQNKVMMGLLEDCGVSEETRQKLSQYPVKEVSLSVLHSLSHFYMVAGHIAPSLVPSARAIIDDRGILVDTEDGSGNVLVLSSRKNRWGIEGDLKKLGFTPIEVPEGEGSVNDECRQLDDKLFTLKTNLEKCRLNMVQLGETFGAALLRIRSQIRCHLAILGTRKHFGQLASLTCISGWIPKNRSAEVKAAVAEETSGTGVVVCLDAEEDEGVKSGRESVPVKFSGGALSRPFQMLVKNFGVPQYNEIDPTAFVGLTFVLLFGFMFGDVGHGLVLMSAGLWLCFTKNKKFAALRDSGTLLALCGGAAMVFGFAYGSIFGYEHWLKPLWLNPMASGDIMHLLLTAIGIGIVFSSAAIIINIINHFIAKKYYEGAFDKFGLIGLVFFWSCLGIGVWVISGHAMTNWMIALIVTPLALLFIKEPLHNLIHRRGLFNGNSAITVILEAVIETMETLTGYLSGTVSFIRIGAFAISHAALCYAIFTIVNMLKNVPGSTLWQILVIIFGNLLVICFEGMVDLIQGVRLEYYELFGKFFGGGGTEYKPFDLKEKEERK